VRQQEQISKSRRTRDAVTRGRESRENACGTAEAPARARHQLCLSLAALVGVAAVIFAFVAPAANATRYQRPFKEVFGSAAQPSFQRPATLAIDRATGDVLVGEEGTQSIRRFKADGTPDPFTALGTNVIDGQPGPGGKPCAEEPASCDETPSGNIRISEGQSISGIAVDESEGPAKGDIYVVQFYSELIDIFASDGRYLGALTQVTGGKLIEHPCGVAVDASGAVYVADLGGIHEYVPTANPPVTADNTENFPSPSVAGFNETSFCGISSGDGAIFGETDGGNSGLRAYKVNEETGQLDYAFGEEEEVGVGPTVVDPSTGNVLVKPQRGSEALEFDVSSESEAVLTGRLVPRQGGIDGIAVAGSGDVYIAGASYEQETHVEVYGAPAVVPTVTAEPAAGVSATKATLTGTVNPGGLNVSECVFEYGETASYGNTASCEGAIPSDTQTHPVHATISNLLPNGHTYYYRIAAKNANGTETSGDQTLVTADRAITRPATEIGTASATLNGIARPEGLQFSDCKFEYGRVTSATFEHSVPCDPPAAAIEPDLSPHAVSAIVTGLLADEAYRFRLVTTDTEGTLYGEELTFTSLGAPRISEVRARDADQSSAVVEAKVNPSGFATSYQVEWGPTTSYGNDVPVDFEPYVGEGEKPVQVTAKLAGLSSGVAYHYRIVARNKAGTTYGEDEVVETVDSCGLPDQRCFELVSPHELGPVARPGIGFGGLELHFQAASQPGSLAYFVEAGLPGATKGTEDLYEGDRGASGWSSSQFSAPIVANDETNSDKVFTSKTLGISENLECAVTESNQPLTSDGGTRLVREAGGENLYRRNPDRSYTAISSVPPENLSAVEGDSGEYVLAGFSNDCAKVVFSTEFHYPGVEGAGSSRLYEWEDGTLRNVGFVPGPIGEVPVEAGAGSPVGTKQDLANVVSSDGSRIFFTATRQTSPNPAEIGKKGVFVREDGVRTRDVSLSETATPDEGATYQYASKDGSRVFFTANAGLTEESSGEGTDLYEYDLESAKLTDLSVDHNAGGAEVAGFVGASEDGTSVYFVARGQLVPGRGMTFAQNQTAKTYSLYGEQGGALSYVGAIGEADLVYATVEDGPGYMNSQVSPDGRYLLFESNVAITPYEPGSGVKEAYLYDADASSEATICVSCRQDGEASDEPLGFDAMLLAVEEGRDPLHTTRSLVVEEGVVQAYFTSFDNLAPSAIAGRANIYEWSHGQIFLVATEPEGLLTPEHYKDGRQEIHFAGASVDGTDLYFTTTQALNWENSEERWSVYDARVDGGFPVPPPASPLCEPDTEGSCQTTPSPPPTLAEVASASFEGPGNLVVPLAPTVSSPKPKPTRAQQLRKALAACHKYKARAKRAVCEKHARTKYGAQRKNSSKKSSHTAHKGGK
jgi:hypothetical protein